MTSEIKTKSEIFRHIRPHWYDRKSHQLVPYSRGGISFLLHPKEQGVYDFWVYICPEDIEFSSRQAVKTLRERASSGIVPFGTVHLTDEPLVDVITRYVISEQMNLPSEASKQLLSIVIINAYAKKKLQEQQEKATKARAQYEEDTIRKPS